MRHRMPETQTSPHVIACAPPPRARPPSSPRRPTNVPRRPTTPSGGRGRALPPFPISVEQGEVDRPGRPSGGSPSPAFLSRPQPLGCPRRRLLLEGRRQRVKLEEEEKEKRRRRKGKKRRRRGEGGRGREGEEGEKERRKGRGGEEYSNAARPRRRRK